MGEPQVYLSDQLESGLVTWPQLDDRVPHLRVLRLAPEGGFRGSGLKPGDQILAVEGEPVAGMDEATRKLRLPQLPGQYQEDQAYAKKGLKDGDALTLTVRRRTRPTGWQTLEVKGRVRAKRNYRDANNSAIPFEGGPNAYERDGFSDSWPGWLETLGKQVEWALCEGWRQPSAVSAFELKQLLAHAPRVELLTRKYPGPFATAVQADHAAAVESSRGTPYSLEASALDFRRADEERAAHVARAGQAAWQGWLEEVAAETITPFPAPHPIFGKPDAIQGKYAVLGPIPTRDWFSDMGRNVLVCGSNEQGRYVVDAESPAAFRMFRAVRRYTQRITPRLREDYTLLVRIGTGARMVVIAGVAHWALAAEPLAARVGDAFAVDLRQETQGDPPFVGEADATRPSVTPPPDDASPQAVLETMVAALKTGDLATWKALFADWMVSTDAKGRPRVRYDMSLLREADFEDSRRLLMGKVCDARVVWSDEPIALTTGEEFEGAPVIEEVEVELEHIGATEDGHRAFKDITVHRLWRLQRINKGPWRIASAQGL